MIFKHAFSILRYNKVRTLFFVFLYGFCMFSICFIPTVFDAQYLTEISDNLREYGKMNCVLTDITPEEVETMDREFGGFFYKKGYVKTYGEAAIGPETIKVGYIDSTSIELGNIRVVEGRLPKGKDEFALEERYRETAGLAPGDKVSITIGGTSRTCTFTGYTSDYVKNLMYSYPGAFFGADTGDTVTEYDMCVFFKWAMSYRDMACLRFPQNIISEAMITPKHVEYNYRVYSAMDAYTYDMNQTFMMFGIFFTVVFVVYIIFTSFLENLGGVLYDLRLFGATNNYVINLKFVISMIALTASVLLFFFVYFIMIHVTERFLGVRIYLLNATITRILFGFMILFPIAMLLYSNHEEKERGERPISFSQNKAMRYSEKHMDIKHTVTGSFTSRRIKFRWVKLASFGCALAIFVSVLLVMTEDINYRILVNRVGYDYKVSFDFNDEIEKENIDGYIYSDKKGGALFSDARALKGFNKGTYEFSFLGNDPSLIVEKNSPYLDRVYDRTYRTTGGFTGEWITSADEGNFRLLEVAPHVREQLEIMYGEDIQKYLEGGKAILIMNPFEIGEDEFVDNDVYKDGDVLHFVWTENGEKKSEDIEVSSVYQGSVFTRMVFKQYNDSTFLVLVSEEKAASSPLMSRIDSCIMQFDKFMILSEYEGFESSLLQPFVARYPSIYVNYLDDERMYSANLEINTLTFVKNTIVGCEFLLVVFSILNIIFEKYNEFEKVFMTMRSVGYRKRHVFISYFLEYIVYLVFEILILLVFNYIMSSIYLPTIYKFPVRTMLKVKMAFNWGFAVQNTIVHATIVAIFITLIIAILTYITNKRKLVNFIKAKE